ncbi:MAG: hypothetical protein HUU47_02580 [Bacteroidetes bacterium]|nr:hypothetical protein [Bacteroidota bacterium]
MKKIIITAIILCSFNLSQSQNPESKNQKSKVTFKTGGTLNLSFHPHKGTNLNSLFLNFGGPGIKFDYGQYSIAYNMFPSIRYYDENTSPILGTGVQLTYKKYSFVAPMYYVVSPNSKKNVWIVSFGFGYKL